MSNRNQRSNFLQRYRVNSLAISLEIRAVPRQFSTIKRTVRSPYRGGGLVLLAGRSVPPYGPSLTLDMSVEGQGPLIVRVPGCP